MKKQLKANKISRTGKSYKFGWDAEGNVQLIRTTANDPDALSIIRKGTDAVYCPICGEPECIKQIAKFSDPEDINIDLQRSLYREMRMCSRNNVHMYNNLFWNKNTIANPVELWNNYDLLKLLENQSQNFYLVENFAYVIFNPNVSKKIICPSCGSHPFHKKIYPIITKKDFLLDFVFCPDCSMSFWIEAFASAWALIKNQLARIPAVAKVLAFGSDIKHIFIVFPFSIPAKFGDRRKSILNYPTDYIRLRSPIRSEELFQLFPKFREKAKIAIDILDELSCGDVVYGLRKFSPLFYLNIKDLIHMAIKREFDNVLVIFVFGGEKTDAIIAEYLGTATKSEELKPRPASVFAFSSTCYPDEVANSSDWKEKGKWVELPKDNVLISPFD